MLLFSTAAVDS